MDENNSARVGRELIGLGFDPARIWALKGGWNGWKDAGLPVAPK